jgi:RNA polymerase sigma-70 factor (ECF subfamily)
MSNQAEGIGRRWTELLLAARQGEAGAFDLLVQEAGPVLWRRALLRVHDRNLADDVVAGALGRAWRGLADFDPALGNGATWLLRIVDNLGIDVARARARRQEREVTGFDLPGRAGEEGAGPARLDPPDEVESTPAGEADDHALRRLVAAAMQQLPAKDREVARLFYFERLGYDEIAARLNTTVQAVGPRLTRLRRKLEELLEEAAE